MRPARRTACVAVVAILALGSAALPAPGATRGDAEPPVEVRNVLVPGQSGAIPPDAHSTDQIPLYDGLTPRFDQVTAADVEAHFKPAPLGDRSGTQEPTPRPGLTIVRDAYGVPKVFAKRRADVEFGAGWVTAHDRSFLLEVLRGPARMAALDAPGVDAFSLARQGAQFQPSEQTEGFLSDQIKTALGRSGARGRQVLADIDAYLEGINAYYRATGNPAKPWTRNDVVASTALIGAVFGRGGGDEVANADLLARLRGALGEPAATQVFRDLREVNDPEAPTTLTRRFVYASVPTGATPGSPVVDAGSVTDISALTPRQPMSNALLLPASRTASGHPIAVMGPQVGYYYPEILMELELHGGGLDARGAAFPGLSAYVLLGRGKHYAWSATSAGSDNVDQFLEELCAPDGSPPTRASTHYRYRNRCVEMTTFDAGTLTSRDGVQQVSFHETVHGPVSGTATIGGRPYAITTRRSTRGREAMNALAIVALNENRVDGPAGFRRTMSQMEYTFNWLYTDAAHTAYFSSGRLPQRAAGTDPSLPTLGTGRYDWRGFLPAAGHPQATDAPILLNWNNKPAPGFGAADDNWSYGAFDHVSLFTPFAARGNEPRDVVAVMNKAGTQDDVAVLVWPIVSRVLAGGPAPDARSAQAVALVDAWLDGAAGTRLDRNGDGSVDAPGAPIFDAAFPEIAKAVLRPVLGDLAERVRRSGRPSYVSKDLRTLLGERVAGRYSRGYCGNGDLTACRASLWAAVQAAVGELAVAQGPDPNAWRAPEGRTSFVPGILSATIRETSRPTFQQVVEFRR